MAERPIDPDEVPRLLAIGVAVTSKSSVIDFSHVVPSNTARRLADQALEEWVCRREGLTSKEDPHAP